MGVRKNHSWCPPISWLRQTCSWTVARVAAAEGLVTSPAGRRSHHPPDRAPSACWSGCPDALGRAHRAGSSAAAARPVPNVRRGGGENYDRPGDYAAGAATPRCRSLRPGRRANPSHSCCRARRASAVAKPRAPATGAPAKRANGAAPVWQVAASPHRRALFSAWLASSATLHASMQVPARQFRISLRGRRFVAVQEPRLYGISAHANGNGTRNC